MSQGQPPSGPPPPQFFRPTGPPPSSTGPPSNYPPPPMMSGPPPTGPSPSGPPQTPYGGPPPSSQPPSSGPPPSMPPPTQSSGQMMSFPSSGITSGPTRPGPPPTGPPPPTYGQQPPSQPPPSSFPSHTPTTIHGPPPPLQPTQPTQPTVPMIPMVRTNSSSGRGPVPLTTTIPTATPSTTSEPSSTTTAPSRRMYPTQPTTYTAQQPQPGYGAALENDQGSQIVPNPGQLYTPAGVTSGMAQMSMGTPSVRVPSQQAKTSPMLTFQQLFGHLPPTAVCDKRFMRMTCNAIPGSQALASKWALPLGCIVRPVAPPSYGQAPVQVLESPNSLVRCMECRAYINPFVTFQDGGRRWICCLCNKVNEVPHTYQQATDMQAIARGDYSMSPELCNASSEFVATKDYMFRAPQPPAYLFVLDTTGLSVTSGMIACFAAAVKNALARIPGDERTLIGFITFDNTIHFYNLSHKLSQPQMMVVPDVNDILLPMPNDIMVNLSDCRKNVDLLLDKLPQMFQPGGSAASALGPALSAAVRVLKPIGGKIIVLTSTLPTLGVGNLKPREDRKLLGTDKERSLLQPLDEFYKSMAVSACASQICFDTFFFSDVYTDIASISALSKHSGGSVNYYPQFRSTTQGEKFMVDIDHLLTCEQGFEAVLRVRCSKGVRIDNYFGHFFRRSTDLLTVANVDSDKTFAVELKLEEATLNSSVVYLQTALLYTVGVGERRIRTHTIAIPVTHELSDMYRFADVTAVTSFGSKIAIERAMNNGTPDAREYLVKQCLESLRVYKNQVSSQAKQSAQLVLPETLKLLPVYTLGLIKHRAFRSGGNFSSDDRSFLLRKLTYMSAEQMVPFVYPRMSYIWPLPDTVPTVPSEDGVGLPLLNLSVEKLAPHTAVILVDSTRIWLWLGREVHPQFLIDMFGVQSLQEITAPQQQLVPRQNESSEKFFGIVEWLRNSAFEFLPIEVVRNGDPAEQTFLSLLIEDKNATMMGYSDFLNYLHKEISK